MKSSYLSLLSLVLMALAPVAISAQIPTYVPTDGLVGWWPFNGNANDESGNGNDGTVNGATLTEDRFGNTNNAFQFDGDDKIQTIFSGPTGSGISLSFWYKTSEVHQMQTISYGSTQFGGYFGAYLNHYSAQTSGPCYGPALTNAGTLVNKGSDVYPDSNVWHHSIIIIPVNAIDLNDVIFYLDDVLLSGACSFANYGAPSPNINDGNPIIFGGGWYSGFPYNDFTGKLDDIAFYNRALTPEEVQELYTGEPVNPPTACNPLPSNLQTSLVGYWPFCGNANDESGNGNDGVVNGATLTEDRFGNVGSAYSFDGVSNFIDLGNNLDGPTSNQNFSVNLWVSAESDANGTLISKYENYNSLNSNYGLFYNASDDEVVMTADGTSSITIDGAPALNWVMISAVFNPIENSFCLYKNGQITECMQLNVLAFNSNNNTLVGQVSGFPATNFHGSLDDIGIWNRALTPEEIRELYTLDACAFTVYDTVTVENVVNVFDTTSVVETLYEYDTLTVQNIVNVFDTTNIVETLYEYDTLTIENIIDVYDTTWIEETVVLYDTITVENTVTVYDTSYVSVTDTLIIDVPSSVGSGEILNTLLLYPNPTQDQLTINYGNFAAMAGYSLNIFNNAGSAVHNTLITQAQETLDISTWSAGVYQVVIFNASAMPVETRQILIQ